MGLADLLRDLKAKEKFNTINEEKNFIKNRIIVPENFSVDAHSYINELKIDIETEHYFNIDSLLLKKIYISGEPTERTYFKIEYTLSWPLEKFLEENDLNALKKHDLVAIGRRKSLTSDAETQEYKAQIVNPKANLKTLELYISPPNNSTLTKELEKEINFIKVNVNIDQVSAEKLAEKVRNNPLFGALLGKKNALRLLERLERKKQLQEMIGRGEKNIIMFNPITMDIKTIEIDEVAQSERNQDIPLYGLVPRQVNILNEVIDTEAKISSLQKFYWFYKNLVRDFKLVAEMLYKKKFNVEITAEPSKNQLVKREDGYEFPEITLPEKANTTYFALREEDGVYVWAMQTGSCLIPPNHAKNFIVVARKDALGYPLEGMHVGLTLSPNQPTMLEQQERVCNELGIYFK